MSGIWHNLSPALRSEQRIFVAPRENTNGRKRRKTKMKNENQQTKIVKFSVFTL